MEKSLAEIAKLLLTKIIEKVDAMGLIIGLIIFCVMAGWLLRGILILKALFYAAGAFFATIGVFYAVAVIREKRERSQMRVEGHLLYIKDDPNPYCLTCFEERGKKIHLIKGDDKRGEYFYCPVCFKS